jgi:phosphatidate cytidylyltransferase
MSHHTQAGAPPSPVAPSRGKLATFVVRTASAIALIAVIALCLWLWQPGFILLIAAMTALGVIELRNAAHRRGIEPTWQIAVVATPVIVIGAYLVAHRFTGPPQFFGFVFMFVVAAALACFAWRLRRDTVGYLADVGVSVFTIVYLAGLATFVVAMMVLDHPVVLVVSYALCVVANDSGAYLLGSAFGRHKMVPHISPAKTWEGFAGGVLLGGVVGWLVGEWLLDAGVWRGIVLGVVLSVGATLGDLVESAVKRDAGVKDSGRFLPGHGGVLDRVDSMLYCAPIALGCYLAMGVR